MSVSPTVEWLYARLRRGPAPAQELLDEAATLGITPEELTAAHKVLSVKVVRVKPDYPGSVSYAAWECPVHSGFGLHPGRVPEPAPVAVPVEAELVRADQLPSAPAAGTKKPKRTPTEQVGRAKNRIMGISPRAARYLDELLERASDDAPPCPSCGRGTPRGEEIRLRAILAVLDRAGVAPAKGVLEFGDSGPVLVFPPGTTMGVLARPPEPDDQGVGRSPTQGITLVRGDNQ